MGDGLIERLKAKVIVAESTKGPVKRLRNPDGPKAASRIAELEAENARLRGDDRIGTHSPDCWSLGPKHYDCATRRVAELEAKLATAVASLDEAAEYVERFADMRDGDYGGQEPNEAMQLAHSLRQALASIQERT